MSNWSRLQGSSDPLARSAGSCWYPEFATTARSVFAAAWYRMSQEPIKATPVGGKDTPRDIFEHGLAGNSDRIIARNRLEVLAGEDLRISGVREPVRVLQPERASLCTVPDDHPLVPNSRQKKGRSFCAPLLRGSQLILRY